MRNARGLTSCVLGSLLLLSIPGCGTPTHQISEAAPPTGHYVSDQFSIAIHLEPSGSYQVSSDSLGQSTSTHGRWVWDGEHEEFLLNRGGGDFKFAIRKLRVDQQDPSRLQWIPPSVETPDYVYDGVIDYVSFKLREE